MDAESPLWIAESEVVSLIDLGEAISQVRDGLVAQAGGAAVPMPKSQASWPGGTVHATGATLHHGDRAYVGTKSWSHTAGGATPLLTLWDAADGRLLAVLEAFALGQYRTAAVSGVATDRLASADATTMAICGTGAQALAQVATVNAVRALDTLRVWSPRPESRQRFCGAVRDALGIEATEAAGPEEAVDGADVVTLVTRSRRPFLTGATIGERTHVNAIGAIGLERAEFGTALLKRADIVAVDDIASARSFSREMREYYGCDGEGWGDVASLADLVAARGGRPERADLTLFKAMGTGIADLAIAVFVYEQAVENRLGTPLPPPSRSRPRLRSSLRPAAPA
ncbi:ornithine cyclodeaminase family protein [Pseudonocardia sp.]|uniref:ornithine cyclodeaminase family protein n=1 Tax=Pseudonocardia sp. TaxID=60912 RepID=UPI002615139A|nr:ornithine cyclodeaminase family protein [Pseudonocardia sp.]